LSEKLQNTNKTHLSSQNSLEIKIPPEKQGKMKQKCIDGVVRT
jgi:hypothetical protein